MPLPFATVRFFADALLPDEVSHILDMKPAASAAKGDGLLKKGDGSRGPARTGTWFATTESMQLGYRPEDHLAWVVQFINQHIDQLRDHIPDIRVDLSLLIHDRDFELEQMPSQLLEAAVQIGDLEIEIVSSAAVERAGAATGPLARRVKSV